MKAVLLCVLALAALAVAQPIRPVISETFESMGYSHLTTVNDTIWGLGRWLVDEPKGLGLETWEYEERHEHHWSTFLQRFDIGFEYHITFFRGHPQCRKHTVHAPMPPHWDWLRHAHYVGKRVHDDVTYDEWRHSFGGTTLSVSVHEHRASVPVYYSRRSASVHLEIHWIDWGVRTPNATFFHVPTICQNVTEVEELPAGEADLADTDEEPVGSRIAFTALSNNGDISAAFLSEDIVLPDDVPSMLKLGGECTGLRAADLLFPRSLDRVAMYMGDGKVLDGEKIIEMSGSYLAGCARWC